MKSVITLFIYSSFLGSVYFGNAQSPLNKGFLMLETGDFEKATTFFEAYLQEYPEHKTAKLCYGRAIGLSGKPQEAQSIFGELLLSEPDNLEFKVNYAESLLWNKMYESALAYYLQLLTENKNNAIILLGLANTYSNLQQHSKAIKTYRKAITINPNIIGVYIGLAYTQHSNQQNREALKSIDKGLAINHQAVELIKLKQKIDEQSQMKIEQASSLSFDSGEDQSEKNLLRLSFLVKKKLKQAIYYRYRNAQNKLLRTSAMQHEVGTSVSLPLNYKWSFFAKTSLLYNLGAIQRNHFLYSVGLTRKFSATGQLVIDFTKEMQDFNTQLIQENLSQQRVSIAYHHLFKNRLGWYSNINYQTLSDNNNNLSVFSSFYYCLQKKTSYKFGVNLQYLGFSEEQSETYFSPKQLGASEVFIESTRKVKDEAFSFSGLFAYGYQARISEKPNATMRLSAEIVFHPKKNIEIGLFGKHSSNAIANVSEFTFSEIGLNAQLQF